MNERVNYPTIPTDVVVHLGAPSEASRNISVPFTTYIKNVASNEIFPSWPDAAIEANILAIISFTLLYAFLAVIGAVLYSLIIALLLNMDIFGRTIFRSIFFIPYLLPAIGVFKGWQWLYEQNYGLFNFIFRMLGIPPQRFLDSPKQVIPSLVLIAVWASGNLIVIFLAGLQNVPTVYKEAAQIDGANSWQRFWNITIPCIKPIIFYNVLTALITHLQVVNPALALTNGGPAKKSMFLSYVIYMYGFEKNKLGYAAAFSVIFFALVGIFTIVLFVTQKDSIFSDEA